MWMPLPETWYECCVCVSVCICDHMRMCVRKNPGCVCVCCVNLCCHEHVCELECGQVWMTLIGALCECFVSVYACVCFCGPFCMPITKGA